MRLERAQRMDIDHVDDETVLRAQTGRGRLREKQGRFQVAPHEIVPLRHSDLPDRRRVKTGRVID
jgi:hypothetical protein